MDSIKLLTQKNSNCTELLSCLFSLRNNDIDILYIIGQKKQATLTEISELINRDRSSVHRCLSKLLSAGLLQRRTKALKEGGYYHEYSLMELSSIKKQTEDIVDLICNSLRTLLDRFEEDFLLKTR